MKHNLLVVCISLLIGFAAVEYLTWMVMPADSRRFQTTRELSDGLLHIISTPSHQRIKNNRWTNDYWEGAKGFVLAGVELYPDACTVVVRNKEPLTQRQREFWRKLFDAIGDIEHEPAKH